jgi:DNA-binding transcriptional LysR family regulator
MHIDLNLLQTFVAVAELRSFTSAARYLNATQSTVSHQITRLEQQLGRKLLARTTRSTNLTEDGERLMSYAARIETLRSDLLAEFANEALTGQVVLSVPEDLLARGFATMLELFKRCRPNVTLRVQVGLAAQQREWMAAGQTDLAIIRDTDRTSPQECLWSEPILWVGADAMAKHLARSSAEPLPFVHVPPPCLYRDAAMAAMTDAGLRWETVMTCPHLEGIRSAVMANLGVAAVAESAAPRDARRLGAEHGLPALPDCRLALHKRTDHPNAAAEALCDLIRRYDWAEVTARVPEPL